MSLSWQGSGGCRPLRNRADRTGREFLILDVEAAIESGSIILPGDRRCQLDELFVAEFFAQPDDLFVRRSSRGVSQGDGVVKNDLLQVTECVTVCVVADSDELFFGDAMFSADGRADIQSEDTSDHRGDFQ